MMLYKSNLSPKPESKSLVARDFPEINKENKRCLPTKNRLFRLLRQDQALFLPAYMVANRNPEAPMPCLHSTAARPKKNSPGNKFQPNFMPGKSVSDGKSKLCHMWLPKLVLLFSLRTRFPESNICALELCTVAEEFDDQTTLFVMQLSITRLPSVLIVRTPFDPVTGISLFAIHTTIFGNFLYHIPKYRLVDLEPPGEKKPNSKILPFEIKVSPSLMDSPDVILSAALQNSKTKNGMKSE
ncbi:hypothetical protein RJ639_046817 [Escallonia herrerae]|uniref:Uncharacterized protein n=1 Tax=Escallonia herrerae TaxID=1293975 RepID=A0AA88W8T4_9ASTE|nr:hypothetical protein RJ639_046817 [Escallonia herrerae]